MSKIFLQLPRDEQSKILRALGPALSRALHDDFRRMVDAGMFIALRPRSITSSSACVPLRPLSIARHVAAQMGNSLPLFLPQRWWSDRQIKYCPYCHRVSIIMQSLMDSAYTQFVF